MPASTRLLAGRYRLDLLVGEGGVGTVWRGHDERLGRDVAVKVVRPDAADPAAVARFEREARVVAGLRHPGLVLVHDFGTEDGAPFLVMELLPGPSLARVLAEEGALDIARAIRYAREAADALAAAHHAGVVHRDVKPGNLVLDGHGLVRVVDFGLARLEREADATLTAAGHVVGSAAYLAPEQASGGPVDARADLYSLGCVLVALLTGRPPFTGDTPVSVALQHLHTEPPDLRRLRPDVPVVVAKVVADLLEKDPARRPADATEVVERLDACGAAVTDTAVLPVLAAPPATVTVEPAASPARATASASGRRAVPVTAAALATGALLAALAAGVLTGNDPNGDAAPPPAAAESPAAQPTEEQPEPEEPPTPQPSEPEPAPEQQAPADQETALAELRAAVTSLGTEGPERRARRDLERRLERVESALRDGDPAGAAERLDRLSKEVADLVDEGRVPAASGQVVLDAASALRSALPEDPGGDGDGREDDREDDRDDD